MSKEEVDEGHRALTSSAVIELEPEPRFYKSQIQKEDSEMN